MAIDRVFWEKTGERAVKTFAQAFVAAGGTLLAHGLGIPWADAAEVGAGAAILSVLTSLASYPIGERGDPSALPQPRPPAGSSPGRDPQSPTGPVDSPAGPSPS